MQLHKKLGEPRWKLLMSCKPANITKLKADTSEECVMYELVLAAGEAVVSAAQAEVRFGSMLTV